MKKQSDIVLEFTDDAINAMKKILNLFRHNRIPTDNELRKPVNACNKFGEMINENMTVISLANFGWMTANRETIALKRPDEHNAHYMARTQIELLSQNKKSSPDFVKLLTETIEKLKEEGF
jgi:hypothetical protein